MRLIDADELKEKLLKMQKDIANGIVSRGNSKSDTWKAAYLLIFDEYIKLLDQSPTVINDCDAELKNGLANDNKDIIKSIPNFDSDKFFEITGILPDERLLQK